MTEQNENRLGAALLGVAIAAAFMLIVGMIKQEIYGPWSVCTRSHVETHTDTNVFNYYPSAGSVGGIDLGSIRAVPNPSYGQQYTITVCDEYQLVDKRPE